MFVCVCVCVCVFVCLCACVRSCVCVCVFITLNAYIWHHERAKCKQKSAPNIPYSRRGHDEHKSRLGWKIYRKFARQYVNPDVTSLLLNVHVT